MQRWLHAGLVPAVFAYRARSILRVSLPRWPTATNVQLKDAETRVPFAPGQWQARKFIAFELVAVLPTAALRGLKLRSL